MLHSRMPLLASDFIMDRLTLYVICFCLLSARLLLSEHRPKDLPTPLLRWMLFTCPFNTTVHSMTRPRGRPKRGSPWKPRRPPVKPPSSPSGRPSPRPQSAALLQDSMVASLATTSRSPISSPSHLHVPLVKFQPPAPFHG
jgi:hypothetical protein